MNLPPLLLGMTLLLWGYQTGMVLPALMMAVVVEAARWIKLRWEFSTTDYHRAWDFSVVLFVASALYCFIARDSTNDLMEFFQAGNFSQRNRITNQTIESFFILFQWGPMTLFPCLLTQIYGTRDKIPFTTFSWYLRRQATRSKSTTTDGLNFGWIFLAVVLAATSVTNTRDPVFFVGLCGLVGWALWATQPRRFSNILWLCIFALVIKLAWWSQLGLAAGQALIEGKVANWASSFGRRPSDRLDSNTSIGKIGRLKLSGKIVMRIEAETVVPSLLRDSSFSVFTVRGNTATWAANKRDYKEVLPEGTGTDSISYHLLTSPRPLTGLTISTWLERGNGFLALPQGTTELENLEVTKLETNRFGVVRVSGGPTLARFRARFGRGPTADDPPENSDLNVPTSEKALIENIADELALNTLSASEKIQTISAWFAQNFTYSSFLTANASPAGGTNDSPLAFFLRRSKAGHCEYFATATVLLLRQAGIPARYANGYSLQEPDKGGKKYIVRERHAHAWTLFWMNGAWQELDTTPGTWVGAESVNASFWEPVRDFISSLWFRFNVWRQESAKTTFQRYLAGALVVLISVLAWRLFFGKKRAKRQEHSGSPGENLIWPGIDSEFFLVEQRLADGGFARVPGETFATWLARVRAESQVVSEVLSVALSLHYRHRFDPRGLSVAERAQLKASVQAWLNSPRA